MSTLDVRIVKLEPLRVVSSYGFGPSPEAMAHEKMIAFLKANNLLEGYGKQYQHFGFNNPSPTPGSPNYGYEVWVTVPAEVVPSGDLRLEQFGGGLYAVTRMTDVNNFEKTWGELVRWRESSSYKKANHQWLENFLNPLETDLSKCTFDLYLPISA